MLNRRDLLKFFGVGSTIVPVISGTPIAEPVAQLIVPATVRQIELPKPVQIVEPFYSEDVAGAELVLYLHNGQTRKANLRRPYPTSQKRQMLAPDDQVEVHVRISDGYQSPAKTKAEFHLDGELV